MIDKLFASLRSAVPEIGWPSLPGSAGAVALSLQYQLAHSEWLEPRRLSDLQLRQGALVLRHAVDSVPYYRDRFAPLTIDRDQPLTVERWRELPLTMRQDIQAAGDALVSGEIPATHGRVTVVRTTGSTGRPIQTRQTQLTQLFWNAFTLRDHLWHRREFDLKLAAIRHFEDGVAMPPEGIGAQGWGPATDAALTTGPAVALNIHASIDDQLDWLRREQPDYLLTYPSNAQALAERCLETGTALPGLRELRTLSEVVGPELRDACRSAWDVPVTDMYTAQEVGYLALQCPDREHYHVQAENVLVEVLDEGGAPCQAGQIGRVVVTTLHNFATPLIRYEIGDYAEVGPACDCGRGLPVLRRILGRARNMLRYPDGERRWPLIAALARELEGLPKVRQCQLVQKTLEHIEARVAVPQPLTQEQEEILIRAWRDRFGYPFEITIVYQDDIPRGPGGKFEEFKSEID